MKNLKIILLKYKLEQLTLDEAISEISKEFNISDKPDLTIVKEKLTEFFKNRLVGGYSIKDFRLEESFVQNSYKIIPIEPYLDECYDDEDADILINALGTSLGLRSLGFVSCVYPK